MTKATPRTLLTSLYLSAAALFVVPAALAADERPKADEATAQEECSVTMEKPVEKETGGTQESAMRVAIDPATGAIRPLTEEERKAVAERISVDALLNRSHEGLVVERRPDGSKFVNLQGRFMHALVLTRMPDGRLVAECVDDEHQLHGTDGRETEDAPVR